MKDRVILHCDCNGFYASVECVFRPELREVPMAVCGDPQSRHGIILAKNELAKSYGVATAETIWQARKKCPELVLVPPRRDAYTLFSRKVNAIYQQVTSQVEPFGIDESWLDVTASRMLFGTGPEIADQLRKRVREELGLTISVGVSFNKVFAKLGSDYKKPDATTIISRENYRQLVWPLPVTDLLYVGRAAAAQLEKMGVTTIGELARCDDRILRDKLGRMGPQLGRCARGEDDSPVAECDAVTEPKSVGNGSTFAHDLHSREEVASSLLALCDRVAGRLRKNGQQAATVAVSIKDTQFRQISRQRALRLPTDLTGTLYEAVMALMDQNWDYGRPIRALTVTASGFDQGDVGDQLSLFAPPEADGDQQKRRQLAGAVDRIRSRYGQEAVSLARLVKHEKDPENEER